MEMALNPDTTLDLSTKIKAAAEIFKLSKIEKMLSDAFERLPDESPLELVGELNRYDVMH